MKDPGGGFMGMYLVFFRELGHILSTFKTEFIHEGATSNNCQRSCYYGHKRFQFLIY